MAKKSSGTRKATRAQKSADAKNKSAAASAESTVPTRALADLNRRMAGLRRGMKRAGLDGMIVFDRFNSLYLTGFQSSLSYLLVTPGSARLLVDGRYIEAARTGVPHCEVELFSSAAKSISKWAKEHKLRRVGLEGSIPWSQWREFQEAVSGAECVESGKLILDLRLIKSADEVARLAASAKLNDEVYEAALGAIRDGATEIDLRNVIRGEADRRGAQGLSFDCIVATGAAGSMPHYHPGMNPLRPGDLLLIDMGMLVDGYCSDMTRVVAVDRKPKARLMKAFEATLEAEEKALAAVGPGVPTAEINRIAVDVLKRHGLARYFTHGLGHGVGLEIHESPRLNAVSKEVLEPGMVITIEPGVYLPGLGGVRIEDLCVVTKNGCRVLSHAPKDFRIVPFAA